MALSDFLDRIGTGLANVPPEAWLSLAQGFAGQPNFAKGLAAGLGGLHNTIDQEQKKKSLAHALQGALPNLSPQAQSIFGTLSQDNPDQALQIAAPYLFDPEAQFKAQYWAHQGSQGASPDAAAAPQQAPAPAPDQVQAAAPTPVLPAVKPGAGLGAFLQSQSDRTAYPNNNPGNIRPVGASTGFQSFATPEAGVQAIQDNLTAYNTKHGINTLAGIIARWAPPNENPTDQLIQNASLRTGFKPDQPLDMRDPMTMQKLTQAIITQEQGRAAAQSSPQAAPAAPQAPASPSQLSAEQALAKAQEAARAGDQPTASFYNHMAQQLSDNKLLSQTVDPGYLDALVKYEVAPPSPRDPKYQATLAAAKKLDPNYNEAFYKQINDTRTNFTNRGVGDQIQAINTAVPHLNLLSSVSQVLQNGTDPRSISWLKQAWQKEFGSEVPTNFDTVAETATGEVARAILPGGGTGTERAQIRHDLDKAMAEKQLSGGINMRIALMGGKIAALRQRYTDSMPGPLQAAARAEFDQKFLSPEAQRAFSGVNLDTGQANAPTNANGWKIELVQ